MPDPFPLVLGGVTFDDVTAPEELPFNATQARARHVLIGGRVINQNLGIVWAPIQFKGFLWGSSAQAKSDKLSAMMRSGTTQRLTYLDWALDVQVNYTPTYHSPIKIEYQVECHVIKDQSGKATVASTPSLDGQINAANKNAQGHYGQILSGDPNAASIGGPLQNMGLALDAAGPAASASGASSVTAQQSITAALGAAQAYQTQIRNVVNTPQTQLIYTQRLVAELQVIQANYKNGQAPRTVSVQGGTLQDVCAQYYGDPTLATQLMSANGLFSTHLPSGSQTNLVLPPF